jgi:hypothetical protein
MSPCLSKAMRGPATAAETKAALSTSVQTPASSASTVLLPGCMSLPLRIVVPLSLVRDARRPHLSASS